MKDLYLGKEQVKWTAGKSLCVKLPDMHAIYYKTVRRSVKPDASGFYRKYRTCTSDNPW